MEYIFESLALADRRFEQVIEHRLFSDLTLVMHCFNSPLMTLLSYSTYLAHRKAAYFLSTFVFVATSQGGNRPS